MSDDTAQTSRIDDPLEARVVIFRQQPEAKNFEGLREELRAAGRGELLAELCATYAQHERDPVRAADAWSEAGEAMAVLGETATAVEYLRTALQLDPANERALDRLLELVEPGDPADAVEILEAALAELSRRGDHRAPTAARGSGDKRPSRDARAEAVQRRAALHRQAAELWNDHLGRVDRALYHYQQAWKLEPQRTEALDAARQLYVSLGDDQMVARLYQAELDVLGGHGAAPRRAEIRHQLGRLALRARDLDLAATHLEEAARLAPDALDIAETLAEIYSTPGFREAEGVDNAPWRRRASELFVEIGRQRLANHDGHNAISYLRRAVGVDPYSAPSSNVLEQALGDTSQWDELDRILRHRTQMAPDPAQRAAVLRRRVALYRNQLPNRAGLIECLTELVGYEPPRGDAAGELRELLREDQSWDALSRLMETELNALGADPATPAETLVGELLELATIAREHMGDRDRAAELLHQALGVMPTHEEALARYVDHFRERRDWRGLIDLLEFALDNARELAVEPDELVRRLEEIAQLAELRLGDIPRAIDAWQRIAEIEPRSAKVTEALRRLTARAKMWEQLVASLETEVASAGDPVTRMHTLKKMAQTYRERQIEPRRAIELYEQILAENPGDDATLKALSELYEREGDDPGLAFTLRRILDGEAAKVRGNRALDAPPNMERGEFTSPRGIEWPVAKRSERLTMLRRLAILYETRLADVDGVVFACTAVLELLTGDRDALERMERVLDKANDPRLEQTLEYHAAASSSPAERAKLLKRLARLAAARQDDVAALDRWERTLRASPSDPDALAALAALYERAERWVELAQVLERLDGGRPLPAPATPDAAVRVFELERYAVVVDIHLRDPARATKAWHRVIELSPKSRTALDALARHYRAASKWRELAEVLGQYAIVLRASGMADDREHACAVALERAEILEQRLGAPGDAIKVLDDLIHNLDPNHLDAHASLRRLHEARGDFDAAVRVAEREMYLAPEPARKVARGLEIGLICRDRLANPTRALQAFRRVLELDAEQDEAMAAAADLLYRLGRFKEHVQMIERMLGIQAAFEAPAEERRNLVQRIAQVTADKLGDPKAAFRWWRRAHEEAPDDGTLNDVRRAGEAYGLWRELADVLTDERKRLVALDPTGVPDPERYVALSRELAQLTERKLGDKPRAMTVIAEALAVTPRDASLLGELERLAGELDQRNAWKALGDGFDVALAAAGPAERVELYLRRAKLLDDRVGDSKGAVADVLAAFSWAVDERAGSAGVHEPRGITRDDTREVLVRLAAKARAWNEVIAVDGALIERATSTQRRVELLRRKAQVIEDQLKDAPRAFRTHLIALLLAPDDQDTASHAWRLARTIGKYREVDRAPRAEPPSATIQPDQAYADAQTAASRAVPGRPTQPRRLQTEPLADAELNLHVGDSTQPLDVDEIEIADKRGALEHAPDHSFDSTMALSMNDLARLTVPGRPATTPPRPPVPGATARGTGRLPPLPPKPPQIKPRATLPGVPAAAPRKTQAVVRRPPVPTLPNRPFESPWEELATVYESLPAADAGALLRWLYRAAEVWESGAKDVVRAFDALARAFAVARKQPAATGDGVSHDAEVRARLQRLASEHQAWDRLAELYEGIAESSDTALGAADLLMEVATIRAGQRRPRDAEAQLRRILGMLPSDVAARSKLEELYRNEGRWVELAASLEERTDPRLGTAAPEAERPQLLRELAAIYTGKLQRGHDAIDAFERLRLLAPADTQVLFQLADLYGGVGRWSKVIETLARVGEIAEGSQEARDAQRAIAKIYETELEIPDRAIEAFEGIVSTWPDDGVAWEALDRLYQTQAKWSELADVLRRRAALARDSADRAHLLARRAGVLMDWLSAFEEAAAALSHARTIAPDDASLADQLVIALGRAGRHREAAATLEDRIDSIAHANGPKGELAALHIRLAQLRTDFLDDRRGAREAIDTALELVPEHPTALAVLAQLASPDEDPRAFADAKLREADSAIDDDARIAALMAAGDVLHTRVGDVAGAQGAYERVLALRPYHTDATWALAGLVEKGGDPESAARLLEGQLADAALPAADQARLLTQLAALSRAAGVEPAAERRLLEALAVSPAHVPAIVALSDFYADAGRWDDLEAFLRGRLEGLLLADAAPALVADLHRRLAHAHEKLGRDDDAYQTLVAADRLHRGHLLIKLALGENRYKARRWREAALHLSPLAGHDDAARYPSEVAQGLYHAALAEIRSLRPENAPALYARALELKPSYAPALQALAEVAMEQGDHTRAADLLTRQATATEDPAERLRLFEALGDMALVMLGDDGRAIACFSAAVASAQPIEASHVPLLTKLLERQQLAGDRAGSARTNELMASFGATTAERAARHLEAARAYLEVGDVVRARAAADRAVEADPYDVDACDLASGLAIDAGDVESAAAVLTRLLTARTTSPTTAARHALLSYRLGHARATRGDTRQAIPALERAIQLAPDSDGAIAARSVLVDLSRDDDSRRGHILGHLQAIAAATGDVADLIAWAEELRRNDVGDVGRAALDLAIACGHDAEVHQLAFMSGHEPYAMRDDEAYRAAVEPADREAIALPWPDDLAALVPVAVTLAEAATLLWPDLDAALARVGAPGARRVPSSLNVAAVAMFPRLTTALGLGAAILYQAGEGGGAQVPDIAVACASTPAIVIGPRLAGGGMLAPAVRAHVARAVELARPEHIAFVGLPGDDSARLVAAVARLFGPPALRDAVTARVIDLDSQRAHDEIVRAAMPVRLRSRLEQQLASVPASALDPAAYAAACQRAADRAALLVGGDPRAIVAAARARGDGVDHLVRAIASPAFLAVRARLGVGVR